MAILLHLLIIAFPSIVVIYVCFGISRFGFLRGKLGSKRSRQISALLFVILHYTGKYFLGTETMHIIWGYLFLFWLLSDLLFWLLSKIRKKIFLHYWAGGIAIFITVCYCGIGILLAHHVFKTTYSIDVEGEIGEDSIRIAGFNGSYMGKSFDAEELSEYVNRINQEMPDLVVITGNFMDNDSTYEDMVKSCEALENLQTKYGVYFVWGDYDKVYFTPWHDYEEKDLADELQKNNVIVLEDEVVPVTENLYLCGRSNDYSWNRKSISELLEGVKKENCVIVLNPGPGDSENEEAAKADLVFYGYNRSNLAFPGDYIQDLLSGLNRRYGMMEKGRTHLIVSSGISNRRYKFSAGIKSEYFVVDLY